MKIEKIEYVLDTEQEAKEKANKLIKKGWQPFGPGIPLESDITISDGCHIREKVRTRFILQTMVIYESS